MSESFQSSGLSKDLLLHDSLIMNNFLKLDFQTNNITTTTNPVHYIHQKGDCEPQMKKEKILPRRQGRKKNKKQ